MIDQVKEFSLDQVVLLILSVILGGALMAIMFISIKKQEPVVVVDPVPETKPEEKKKNGKDLLKAGKTAGKLFKYGLKAAEFVSGEGSDDD